jgi:hypothetical protein
MGPRFDLAGIALVASIGLLAACGGKEQTAEFAASCGSPSSSGGSSGTPASVAATGASGGSGCTPPGPDASTCNPCSSDPLFRCVPGDAWLTITCIPFDNSRIPANLPDP